MNALINLHDAVFRRLNGISDCFLPTLARFTFAATLLVYYLNSAKLKLGDGFAGLYTPSNGAYFQIFPKAIEAAGYDVGSLGTYHTLVVLAGTWAEFILPVAIVLGLFTRLAALGMIGFIAMQTLTDLYGHGLIAQPESVGVWFDRFPDSVIMDQRLFWFVVLAILVFKGAGPLSLDRLLRRNRA